MLLQGRVLPNEMAGARWRFRGRRLRDGAAEAGRGAVADQANNLSLGGAAGWRCFRMLKRRRVCRYSGEYARADGAEVAGREVELKPECAQARGAGADGDYWGGAAGGL